MHQRSSLATQARRLTLAPHPAAVPGVRRMARDVLREWGLDALSDDATLLVSELVTNAVRASADGADGSRPGEGAEVVLTMRLTGTSMVIEVRDARRDPARLLRPDASTESGRGLLIVEELSCRWGQRTLNGGKVVWCELPLLDDAFPAATPVPAAVPGHRPMTAAAAH